MEMPLWWEVTTLSSLFEDNLCNIFNRRLHSENWIFWIAYQIVKGQNQKLARGHFFVLRGWGVWIIHTDSWRQLYNIGLRPVIRFRGISPLYKPNNITFHICNFLHYTLYNTQRNLEIFPFSWTKPSFQSGILCLFLNFFSLEKSPCV